LEYALIEHRACCRRGGIDELIEPGAEREHVDPSALTVGVKNSRGGIDELIKPGAERERVELLVEPLNKIKVAQPVRQNCTKHHVIAQISIPLMAADRVTSKEVFIK
jgi:hypothetical protein